jgi:hypothetical protein
MKIKVSVPVWALAAADAPPDGGLFLNSQGHVIKAFSREEAQAFIDNQNNQTPPYMLGCTPRKIGTAELEVEIEYPAPVGCLQCKWLAGRVMDLCGDCTARRDTRALNALGTIITRELRERSKAFYFDREGVISGEP